MAAAALLVALAVLRFAVDDTRGIMLFSVVPISLLGAMLGVRAGVISALFASAVVLVWAATNGDAGTLEYVDQPLTFFLLGGMSGYFAQGTLGDYDLRRARATEELRRAIRHDEIELHYQPIVRLSDRVAVGFEALARWRHPQRGLVPPSEFIPLAEGDRQTILELTLKTLTLATATMRDLIEDDSLFVSLNLSPVALEDAGLGTAIQRSLDEAGVDARQAGFEVTEGAMAEDEEFVVSTLTRLRSLGAGMVAVDDFGVAFSSLGRLAHLPIDTLKIDRALIGESDDASRAVTRGIVELGHAIDLTVIAEGVEDEATMAAMAGMDCDWVQGFLVSRPMPAGELAQWLRASAPSSD